MKYAEDDAVKALAAAFGRDIGRLLPNVKKLTTDATRAPLPTDDETQGYEVGSRWLWQGQEWVRGTAGWVLKDAAVTPEMFGAVGDGVTDDLPAFNAMLSAGHTNIALRKQYRLSNWHQASDALFKLDASASVTIDDGKEWGPRRYIRDADWTWERKVNPASTDPSTEPAVGAYQPIESAGIHKSFLVNQWGKQNLDDNGAVGRTGVASRRHEIIHSGEGDAYAMFLGASIRKHSRSDSITEWGDQNSAGMNNGSVNALTEKVNIYGYGDVVLNDQGHASVGMLGHVTFLYRGGADGAYPVPRFGHYVASKGTLPIDAAFTVRGPMKVAFDGSAATGTDAVLTLASGQKIAFNATPADQSGKFSTQAIGSYYLMKPAAHNALEVGRGADDPHFWRVSGAGTVKAAMGVSGTGAYFTALSNAAEDTFMVFSTAAAGVERDTAVLSSSGSFRLVLAGAGYRIGTDQVVGARQAAIPNAAAGTETDTINAILTAMRTHGLIAP